MCVYAYIFDKIEKSIGDGPIYRHQTICEL